jgi:hypothetical protein
MIPPITTVIQPTISVFSLCGGGLAGMDWHGRFCGHATHATIIRIIGAFIVHGCFGTVALWTEQEVKRCENREEQKAEHDENANAPIRQTAGEKHQDSNDDQG